MLLKAAEQGGTNVLSAVDFLDDGSPICLKVIIDRQTGDAVFDFEGTGAEVRGNLNAPIAVVHSAIIYWSVSKTLSDLYVRADDRQYASYGKPGYSPECRMSSPAR